MVEQMIPVSLVKQHLASYEAELDRRDELIASSYEEGNSNVDAHRYIKEKVEAKCAALRKLLRDAGIE